MAHELYRIREKLNNTPLLISPASFEAVDKYLADRNLGSFEKRSQDGEGKAPPSSYSIDEELGVGVIRIEGPLTYKPVTFMGFDCGGANYVAIKNDFDAIVMAGIKTVVLLVDSGGGEAYQMLDTGKYLRQAADANDVHLIAYVDGTAASAAYGLASAAHEIIATADSEVGSIGVLVQLINDSKALEKDGYERTFVFAGDNKIPFAEDGGWREDFITDLQEKVDATYKEFTSYVAENRGLSVQSIIDTQAKTFMAEKGMELHLVDRIMNHEQFQEYLESQKVTTSGSSPVFGNKLLSTSVEKTKMEKEDMELKEELAQAKAEVETLSASLASVKEIQEKLQAENVSLKAALEEAIAKADTAVAAREELVQEQRKEKLAQVLPADKVEGIHASLVGLDDSAFEAVLAGFSAKQSLRQSTEEFVEMGSQVPAGTKKVVTTKTEEILRRRFQK